MANFTQETFGKHDDYMTPKSAWADIKHLIPAGKTIWEPFYGDGKSGEYLRELGFEVIHQQEDFFEVNHGEVIVSNPPFSKTKQVMTRLKALGKPFIMILPSSKINTCYARDLFKSNSDPLQIIIPKKRIHFQKKVDGKTPEGFKSSCNFDCFYYCWKIGLQNDITWLD